MRKLYALLAPMLLMCAAAPAQEPSRETCAGPGYKHNEVSLRATFYARPSPSLTTEALLISK